MTALSRQDNAIAKIFRRLLSAAKEEIVSPDYAIS
jgi:hypothetical protein